MIAQPDSKLSKQHGSDFAIDFCCCLVSGCFCLGLLLLSQRKEEEGHQKGNVVFTKILMLISVVCRWDSYHKHQHSHFRKGAHYFAEYKPVPALASLKESVRSNIWSDIFPAHIFISGELFYIAMARQVLFTGGVCLSISKAVRIK